MSGLGEGTLAIECDITELASVEAAYDRTCDLLGTPSILINSAGIAGPNEPLESYGIEDWHRVIDINLNGTFYVNRVCVGGMKARGYGRILNVASIAGKEGNPNASAYSASKAAVIGLTKSLGKELAGYDIAVNCVTPAAARTRIFDQMSDEHIDYMLSKIPRGRFMDVRRGGEAHRLDRVAREFLHDRGRVRPVGRSRDILVTTPHRISCLAVRNAARRGSSSCREAPSAVRAPHTPREPRCRHHNDPAARHRGPAACRRPAAG